MRGEEANLSGGGGGGSSSSSSRGGTVTCFHISGGGGGGTYGKATTFRLVIAVLFCLDPLKVG